MTDITVLRERAEDAKSLLEFGRILHSANAFSDISDVFYFFERPWKWEWEYIHWVEMGSPNNESPNWDAYVDSCREYWFHDKPFDADEELGRVNAGRADLGMDV